MRFWLFAKRILVGSLFTLAIIAVICFGLYWAMGEQLH